MALLSNKEIDSALKHLDGWIFSNNKIYKDLKILTARPNIKDSDPVHHLYGFLGGEEVWSVGQWIKVAKDISDKIIAKKMTPIIVGGTGLYFKAITEGLSPIPDIDPKIREEFINLLKSKGINSLSKILKDLDPVAYVRFASVYRNFREEKDFVQFVDKIDVFKKR